MKPALRLSISAVQAQVFSPRDEGFIKTLNPPPTPSDGIVGENAMTSPFRCLGLIKAKPV